jgi:predicted PurR-regulated permease PerM
LTTLFTGTRNFASGFFTTVLFLFFLLVSGDIFLHRLVEILPHFSSKRQVVDISRQIEHDISAYLVTITIMNAAAGLVMALVVWLTGVGDPILWGTVAFLLNYVPILGTALGVLIFLLAGLLTVDTLWLALLPAGLYVGLHLIEGQTLTPMLLARRFTLNPVLVIVALVFWFWMWGIPGAILSVPMLATTLPGSSPQKNENRGALYTARASVGLARLIDCRSTNAACVQVRASSSRPCLSSSVLA